MSEHRVATRYARAVFQLADEQGQADAVRQDMAGLHALIASSADFRVFLTHAGLTAAEQRVALEALFKNRAAELVTRLLDFLVDRRRLPILGELCAAFEEQYRDARGILPAHVTSAFDLRPDQVEALRGKLETKYKKHVDMTVNTDAKLLGGFVVIVKDDVHDFSVKGRLEALRANLAHV